MAVFYREGEEKVRPGIYQRYSSLDIRVPGAQDGICAIPVRAGWGPLNEVVKNSFGELTKNYGSGKYGEGYTIPAAQAMFIGGATTVYTYRMGSGGKKASLVLKSGENDAVTATAKYPGTFSISLSVQPKIEDSTKKEVDIYTGETVAETFTFDADSENEPSNLIHACRWSKYVDLTAAGDGTGTLDNVALEPLTGGEDPKVTNEDYSKAFEALEQFYYNCIALDVNDDEDLSKSLLLQSYLDNAHKMGKLAIAVVGETAEIPFDERLKRASAFDDEKVVYIGSGWRTASEAVEGVMAICQTAGAIAATPANQAITHSEINNATDLLENFTYAQYEDAIRNGMLLPSMSNDGTIWYDSGVNTLINPAENQDDGWKKIRRTKTRFEMFDRIDRALQPKVGRINCDPDGIGDVIQTASRVLSYMTNEKKLSASSFTCERYAADSAWFVITADDIDSLEKIYLYYQFRFAAE